jgi:hemerythrin
MSSVQWTPDLAVGHELIDQQHQELFRRFGELLDACSQQKGQEKVIELLDFLDRYIKTHFSAEEALMVRYAYPDYPEHKEQHNYFVRKIDKLREDLQTAGPSASLVVSTNKTVLRWLIEHIRRTDSQLGSFLKTRA